MSLASRCTTLPITLRRVVAVLVMPLALVTFGFALWLPAHEIREAQSHWREGARRVLAEGRTAPVAQAELEREIAAMRSSTLWSKFYVREGSAVALTSALHADVSAALSSVQASAQSLAPIPAQEHKMFTRIGVRFAASMRINQLQSLLSTLNRHARYLRVERLIVVAPQAQALDENPPLAVTMDVYGFELAAAAVPAAGGAPALALRASP